MKTQYEKYPMPIKFELVKGNYDDPNAIWNVVIRLRVDEAKKIINDTQGLKFRTIAKIINEEITSIGDWEILTGQERDLME